MLEACWLWFVISKEYVELTSPKIESRDQIFFTGTRSRSRISGNDRLFPRGSEFGPNPEIPASPVIQLRPRPDQQISLLSSPGEKWIIWKGRFFFLLIRSRPSWILGLAPNPGSAGISGLRGREIRVATWQRLNSQIHSQNDHFGLVYEMIYGINFFFI